jgi:TP901 family phage tail tape measure protein
VIVGEAEVLITAVAPGFEGAVHRDTDDVLNGLGADAEMAGQDVGANLRGGVKDETGKLEEDLEKDGKKGAGGLTKGFKSGLSGLGNVLGSVGIPTGAFSHASKSIDDTDKHARGFLGTMNAIGGPAILGVTGALAGGAFVAVKLGMGLQDAEIQIANMSGTSVQAATEIGTAFNNLGGTTEFTGTQISSAYASVAGQLKATQGAALTTKQALDVMSASQDLATATGNDLGSTTATVAGVMQAFQLKARDAAHITDVLFNASKMSGQSVDTLGTALEKVRSKLGAMSPPLASLSGLMVDFTEHGITGRAALTALHGTFTALEKPMAAVIKAQLAMKVATSQVDPALLKTAQTIANGNLTTKESDKLTKTLTESQKAQIKQYVAAEGAVQKARDATKSFGVTVLDAKGNMLPLTTIIGELHDKIAGQSKAEATATLTALGFSSASAALASVAEAGAPALQKATDQVSKHGAASKAAQKQLADLSGQFKIIKVEALDWAASIGVELIPWVKRFLGLIFDGTKWLLKHKDVLYALGVLVGGFLATAIGVFTVNKMVSFGQSFVKATGAVGDLIKKLPFFGSAAQENADAAMKSNEEQASSAEQASEAITAAWDAVQGSIDELMAANERLAGSFEQVAVQAGTSAEEVNVALGGTAAVAGTSASEVDLAQTTEQAAMERTAIVAGESAATTDTALASEGGAGALGGGGLLGKAGLVAGAGIGAYLGTSALLKHTPVGEGVLSFTDSLLRMFGADPNKHGVNLGTTKLSPGVEKYIADHGGMKHFEEIIEKRSIEAHLQADKAHADATANEDKLARIANVIMGQDVLPHDVRLVKSEGFGKDIGTMAGDALAQALITYLENLKQTKGTPTRSDVASVVGNLHIHDAKMTAKQLVDELSWAHHTGRVGAM